MTSWSRDEPVKTRKLCIRSWLPIKAAQNLKNIHNITFKYEYGLSKLNIILMVVKNVNFHMA